MRISDWVKKFNIAVKRCEERPDKPQGDVVYRVKEIFTTLLGSWDPSDGYGSIPQWARDAYLKPWGAEDYFDDAGADHNLFALVLDLNGKPVKTENLVRFWSDGFDKLGDPIYSGYTRATPKPGSGWTRHDIWNNYSPEAGEQGAWCWCPGGPADVVVGGGLPNNHHVSTFVVWQAERRSTGHIGPTPDTPTRHRTHARTNGVGGRPVDHTRRGGARAGHHLSMERDRGAEHHPGRTRLQQPRFTNRYAISTRDLLRSHPPGRWQHPGVDRHRNRPDDTDTHRRRPQPTPTPTPIPGTGTRPPTVVLTAENIAHLKTFPRPKNDNGIGLHFHLDLRDEIIAETIEHLRSIRATWTLIYAQDELQAKRAAAACWQQGIMPVVRIGSKINGPMVDPVPFVEALTAIGAPPYVQLFNEPEDPREYVDDETPDDWAPIFGQSWASAAARTVAMGGYAGLQVLTKEAFDAAVDAVHAAGKR